MKSICVVCLLLLTEAAIAGGTENVVRVRDLGKYVGQTVTVKGRTGVIIEAEKSPGVRAFTLRDDYGQEIRVLTRAQYPILGATYYVTGVPRANSSGADLWFWEQSRRRAYPPPALWLLLSGAGILVVGGVVVVWAMLRRRAVPDGLAPAWGYAEVVSGPNQGKSFALRGDEVVVGRGQDPSLAVDLPLDTSVSRRHGLLIREGEAVFYQDTNSSYGSAVNEQVVPGGQRVQLSPGALIGLGPNTVLRVGQAGASQAVETQRAGGPAGSGGGNWGEAQTDRAPSGNGAHADGGPGDE